MRILIVVNTRSGGSDAGLYDFARVLGMRGCEFVVRFVDEDRRAETLVADAAEFDRVVVAGGDGTVSSVCYAMRGVKTPVVVFPAGTGNLLATNLDIPLDPVRLAEMTLDGDAVCFDLGELEHPMPDGSSTRTGFVVIAGAGYDASIMEAAQPLKSAFGAGAYLLAALANLAPDVSEFELVINGEHVSTDGIAVLVVNFARIQFAIPLTHGSDPRDGRLQVVVVRSRHATGLLPAVAAAWLDSVGDFPDRGRGIDVYEGCDIQVSAYPPLRMQYDGEVMDALTPFAARVLKRAALLMVPADSPWSECADE